LSEFQPIPPQKTNGLAIAGFVTSLACCAPVGIVLSAIGLSQINKDSSQKGKGLATAGLIIGIVSLVISFFYFVVLFSSEFAAL
jgi:FtsH-binding integral membrane protein